MKWYLLVLKKYAVFGGRARRREYWMFALFNLLIAIAIGIVVGLVGDLVAGIVGTGTTVSNPASGIYFLATLIPCIAVGVRRMHDIGRSGWWLLFPFVNIIFLLLDGQSGENEYGPNPKMA